MLRFFDPSLIVDLQVVIFVQLLLLVLVEPAPPPASVIVAYEPSNKPKALTRPDRPSSLSSGT